MKLTDEDIRNLLALVARTEDVELTCDEFLERVAPFAEAHLRGELPADLGPMPHHLSICPECREELESLLDFLGGE